MSTDSIRARDTFLLRASLEEHLWMVISDPSIDPGQVLMVNFNSWRAELHREVDLFILQPGEHPFIRKRAYVNYRNARVARLDQLAALELQGQLVRQEPLSSVLLARIREEGRGRLPTTWWNLLVQHRLVE